MSSVAVPLVGRVLEQEGRLELALPRRIRQVRRAPRRAPARVQVEEFDGHQRDRPARTVALLRPPLSADLVQLGGRFIRARVLRAAIPLELVDAVERHVEPVAALVLDDRHLDALSLTKIVSMPR